MEIICQACGKSHKSSAKLEASLENLDPGKKLRLKCSGCGQAILIGRELIENNDVDEALGIGGNRELRKIKVKPPEPPDTSWLEDGVFEEEDVVSDIPQALVLMPEGEGREQVMKALTGLGYRAEMADDTDHALEKMQFFNYSSIVMHSRFSGKNLSENRFHDFLGVMNMSRRRYIFYIIVGPEFKTFYNLEALSNSANLVVNEKDTPHFGIILRKAIPEYEELFGPYMEELKVQGK